ncbi:MAG: hypothetical protein JRG70_16625, partial [Deltaproteobacteria bacterium]|nr:hypothetical protein [Deltaproteobacteria bacterium]
KVNLVLICDVSFQAPVGTLDVDATFSFNVGNFCPDLFVLNCYDSDPTEQQVLPPPNPPLAATGCEVRFRDGDSTCGQNCDPQVCTPTATGLSCVPGPDPGVSTTITCNAAALLDCEGDGIPDGSCTINADTLGTLPEFLDGVVPCVTAVDCGVPDATCDGGFCDFSASNPNLNANFFLACVPPALGGIPGATIVCTAETTDGDLDCNKVKIVNVNCPGLPPCDPSLIDCDDGNDCTVDSCDPSSGVGVCINDPTPAGTACIVDPLICATPFPSSCDGAGTCSTTSCISDAGCDDGNACTVDLCEPICGLCELPSPEPDGTSCDFASCPHRSLTGPRVTLDSGLAPASVLPARAQGSAAGLRARTTGSRALPTFATRWTAHVSLWSTLMAPPAIHQVARRARASVTTRFAELFNTPRSA